MRLTLTKFVLLGPVATIFFTEPAWAYLDPGACSMSLQEMLVGIVGAVILGKIYWHRFPEFLTSRFPGKSSPGWAEHASASSRAHGARPEGLAITEQPTRWIRS
jgi:hypothetical protein